jgi:exopolysaccharide production protein ExoZ
MIGWLRQRFETSRATSGVNLRAMEGMRGVAVLLVFLTHYCTFSEPWRAGGQPWLAALATMLHTAGNAGVDLFFVLSGYVIYKSLVVRRQAFGGFMARRVKRIYPTFLVVFVLYLVLSMVAPDLTNLPPTGRFPYIVANLLMLPGIFPIKPLFTVAWSLSYEMFFYLAVPPLVSLFHRFHFSVARRVAAICACGVALAIWCQVFGAPYIRMEMFMAGMLLHEAMVGRRTGAPGAVAAGVATVVVLLVAARSDLGLFKPALLFAGLFVLCLDCFRRPTGAMARLFGWTPLRWLGNMSYSYYLVHGLFLRAAFLALAHVATPDGHGALFFFAMMTPVFAVSLAGSALLFLAIERPLSLSPPPAQGRDAAAQVV